MPPTGWHHMEGEFRIDGTDFLNVIDKVRIFRESNGIPVGDPKADVTAYICSRFPRQCTAVPGEVTHVPVGRALPNQRPRLLDRVAYWVTYVFKYKHKLTDPETAAVRAEVCRSCPKNREWSNCIVCGDLIGEIKRITNLIRESKTTVHDEELKGCDCHGYNLKAAVWVERPGCRAADAPPQCWVPVMQE